MSALDKRTVALELAYQYRKGQSPVDQSEIEEDARGWAERNHEKFLDDAERLLEKLGL